MARRAQNAPDACSVLRESAGASAIATAAQATAWVGLEQPGPWGSKASTQSHLDADLGGELDRRAAAIGARFALLRSPGSHADSSDVARVVQLCGGLADTRVGWLAEAQMATPEILATFDWRLLLEPEPDGLLAALPMARQLAEPVLWICTNGKRDLCCALRGRPVADTLNQFLPGQVWETTHTGGHRFAPTGIVLPGGVALAGLTARLGAAALAAVRKGRLASELMDPMHHRGRSCMSPPAQAADHAVRQLIGERDLSALSSQPLDNTQVRVTHHDGRQWLVNVILRGDGQHRPDSCGKPAVATSHWETEVSEV